MKKISVNIFICLIIIMSASAVNSEETQTWPLKGNIDLSSGFGDYRFNRFHAGVDLRTNGQTGAKISSPVAGYLYRLKTAYDGYGKGLYLMGDDGFIYVFAHLSNFNMKITQLLRDKQFSDKRYYQDLYFPKDSVRIKKNEMIGISGQTGAGAPHLHFEKRSTENQPVNPLRTGFEIPDTLAPVIEQIIFKMTDNHSLFGNGLRELDIKVKKIASGKYTLDSIYYFDSPFGILLNSHDQMRPGGMNQSVYKLTVYFDDRLYYETVFDSLNYDRQRNVNFEYDLNRAVNKEKNYRRLYHRNGNKYPGSKAIKNNGIFPESNGSNGAHHCRIIAEDCFGNQSQLNFKFLWGPQNGLFQLDSSVVTEDKKKYFHFSSKADISKYGIDSILIYRNIGYEWGTTPESKLKINDDGSMLFEIPHKETKQFVLRLVAFGENCVINDVIFNGIQINGKDKLELSYEILEEGILFEINTKSRFGSDSRLEFYYQDSLLGVEYPRFFEITKHLCFVKPQKKYERIDKIAFAASRTTNRNKLFKKNLNIYTVGLYDNQVVEIDQFCSLEFNKDNFYEPRFIDVSSNQAPGSSKLRMNSKHYQIFPEVFLCKNDFTIKLDVHRKLKSSLKSSICWLDKDNNKWVWLNSTFDDYTLTSKSTGGGSFASIYDLQPPEISRMNIKNLQTYNNNIRVKFNLVDSLSGIEDDRSIVVKIDNEWLIPEYDPESKRFFAVPKRKLSDGKHHMGIMITDRAGNLFEEYYNFKVKKKK